MCIPKINFAILSLQKAFYLCVAIVTENSRVSLWTDIINDIHNWIALTSVYQFDLFAINIF